MGGTILREVRVKDRNTIWFLILYQVGHTFYLARPLIYQQEEANVLFVETYKCLVLRDHENILMLHRVTRCSRSLGKVW